MENMGKRNSEELQIQGLLDRYLNRQAAANGLSTQENHLDEDSLTAFVEGNLKIGRASCRDRVCLAV